MKHTLLFLLVIVLLGVALNHLLPGRLSLDHDGPQLVQLTLFATLLSSAILFHYRNRMGEAFRHALIWVGLALILVIGYTVKEQLIANLIPGRTQVNEAGDLIAHKADDGHFYLDLEVNGVATRMMVDTGASSITLDYESARRARINIDDLRYTAEISTANGRAFSAPITLNSVALGGRGFESVPAFVAGKDALEHPLLGMNFLKRFSRVAVEGDRLIITP